MKCRNFHLKKKGNRGAKFSGIQGLSEPLRKPLSKSRLELGLESAKQGLENYLSKSLLQFLEEQKPSLKLRAWSHQK